MEKLNVEEENEFDSKIFKRSNDCHLDSGKQVPDMAEY